MLMLCSKIARSCVGIGEKCRVCSMCKFSSEYARAMWRFVAVAIESRFVKGM